jgi:hypothetical protein
MSQRSQQKFDPRLVAAWLFWPLLIGGCVTWNILSREHREYISIPDSGSVTDVLAINPFTPYEYSIFMHDDPESHYGSPRETGHTTLGKRHHVEFSEWVGKYGRIRVSTEVMVDHETGWNSWEWIDIYTNGLYLSDVIKKSYLADISPVDGKWFLSIRRGDRRPLVIITLEGTAVLEIRYPGFFDS